MELTADPDKELIFGIYDKIERVNEVADQKLDLTAIFGIHD
jgi:hypothetical protein